MAESAKYTPVNGGSHVVSDFKFTKLFSFRTKRTRAFAYVFIAVFVGFTVFLAFNPSSNPSSPWFSNIFTGSSFRISSSSSSSTGIQANGTYSSSSDSDGSIGSYFSSIYSYFFPSNSSHSTQNSTIYTFSWNTSVSGSSSANNKAPTVNNDPPVARNQTPSESVGAKVEAVKANQTTITSLPSQSASNQTTRTQSSETLKNSTKIGDKSRSETPKSTSENGKGSVNSTSSLVNRGGNNGTNTGGSPKHEIADLAKNLSNCNLFDGDWVRDESYPLYKPGSCSLIDEQFNCFTNGRPDKGFQMLKWKPKACTLPRLDGSHMLQLLRGKRLVFVGDSLNRNMWESLICILRNSVEDQANVYEASGRHHFRSEPSYSFIFKDYNCTVEFFVAPFIVRESETKDKNGAKKETLRLDLVGTSADQYKSADIVVFNTGHWWTHEKTAKGKDYYQEGSHVYSELNVLEAFRKAITTWGRWVDANINPSKTLVFFRGYSASHFRGGQWNSGGQCDNEVEPIKNTTYLTPYPDKMKVLEKVLRGMKTRVSYLNITRLTDFRKDGHPSIYRKKHYTDEERRSPLHFQDCSHWCLPGVPDAWNEILYAELLAKQQQKH
ncbi:protein trichome birefringence-like [Cynara cardunculus var. scolymus]|uniref:protein trichome birefringence-like n=1 Tax=Cynara cardunculus var. scolymus TaxID=59895 RepID=UPI000D62FF44|nr:protein trichome birefringence-like [Cynara cardunculus var. scolymus]